MNRSDVRKDTIRKSSCVILPMVESQFLIHSRYLVAYSRHGVVPGRFWRSRIGAHEEDDIGTIHSGSRQRQSIKPGVSGAETGRAIGRLSDSPSGNGYTLAITMRITVPWWFVHNMARVETSPFMAEMRYFFSRDLAYSGRHRIPVASSTSIEVL